MITQVWAKLPMHSNHKLAEKVVMPGTYLKQPSPLYILLSQPVLSRMIVWLMAKIYLALHAGNAFKLQIIFVLALFHADGAVWQ